MSQVVIKAENISKSYHTGEWGTPMLTKDFERWLARLRRKTDAYPYSGKHAMYGNQVVWALKDLSFEVEQGDRVAITGKNGAGKSTLLKILSRITVPDSGKITGTGRISSLLEAGTGFHPELTGRENIFLNGAILGMRKAEISRKFDEIVGFAGIGSYIDTPVKRYSSGMHVRLAFAVAAHLDSEILIVDEVLAVGDAAFQLQCLQKIESICYKEGRTILLVSHNSQTTKLLCNKKINL